MSRSSSLVCFAAAAPPPPPPADPVGLDVYYLHTVKFVWVLFGISVLTFLGLHICPLGRIWKHSFATAVLCASLSVWAVRTSVDSLFVRFGVYLFNLWPHFARCVSARNNCHL